MEAKQEGKEACGALQLCAGLENRIEGGLQGALDKVEMEGGFPFLAGKVDEAALKSECTGAAGGTEAGDVEGVSPEDGGTDAPAASQRMGGQAASGNAGVAGMEEDAQAGVRRNDRGRQTRGPCRRQRF